MNFEYWDVSKQGNKSVIAYRENPDPTSSQYNNIIVAAYEKEMDVSGDPFRVFYTEKGPKTPIKFFHVEGLKFRMLHGYLDSWFEGCDQLEDISGFTKLDSSNLQYMRMVFKGCKRLKDFSPLAGINTAKVTHISETFSDTAIEDASFLQNWEVSKVVDLDGIFRKCPNLREVDLSKWNISDSCYVKHMFIDTPLQVGYAKTSEIANRINAQSGLTTNCFTVKPLQ